MDTFNNNSQYPEQQQENSPWSWEAMQDGIFQKITDVDPGFFEEKKKRRIPPMLWVMLLCCITMGIGFMAYQYSSVNAIATTGPGYDGKLALEAAANMPVQHRAPAAAWSSVRPRATVPGYITPEPGSAADSKEPVSIASPKLLTISKGVAEIRLPLEPGAEGSEFHTSEAHASLTALSALPIAMPVTQQSISSVIPGSMVQKYSSGEGSVNHLAIFYTGSFSNGHLTGDSPATKLRNATTSARFGMGAGFRFNKEYAQHFGWYFSGVYQKYIQTIDVFTQRRVDYLLRNAVVGVNSYLGSNRSEVIYKDTLVKATESNRLISNHITHYLSAGSGFTKSFSKGPWKVQVLLGAEMQYLMHQRGFTIAEDFGIIPADKLPNGTRSLHFSLSSAMSIERSLGHQFAVWTGAGYQYVLPFKAVGAGTLARPWNLQWSLGIKRYW